MTDLPKQYAWLEAEPGPRILVEALKTYGTIEKPGEGSNPSILAWAKVTGLDRIYRNDATAWCGLWMAYVALQAGWDVPMNPLGARNWLAFGVPQQKPSLGDVLVFWRGASSGFNGHVGLYVGEDAQAFHVLGGNQSDRVMIKRIAKNRLLGAQALPVEDQPAGCSATRRAGSQRRPFHQRSIGEITMFTSIDKALVAAIMGILFIVQTYTGLQLPWATPDTIATIIGLVTPVLVWAIPNKKVA